MYERTNVLVDWASWRLQVVGTAMRIGVATKSSLRSSEGTEVGWWVCQVCLAEPCKEGWRARWRPPRGRQSGTEGPFGYQTTPSSSWRSLMLNWAQTLPCSSLLMPGQVETTVFLNRHQWLRLAETERWSSYCRSSYSQGMAYHCWHCSR